MSRTSSRTSAFVAACALAAATSSAQTILHRFDGALANDWLGLAVSAAGDVNADGFDDVAVGIPFADDGGIDAGRVRVYSGTNGAVLRTWDGDGPGDDFGGAIGGGGDVDGDGYDDVAIGARFDDDNGTDSGSVRVYSGRTGALLRTFRGDTPGDWFGAAVSCAGDFNADGYSDVLVGAPGDDHEGNDAGAARVLSGKDGSILRTFRGISAGDLFGSAVAFAGDADGDGFADVAVGAWRDDDRGFDTGSVQIISSLGGATLRMPIGDSPYDQFGYSVAGAGDVDGDGFDDVAIGAPGDDDNGSGCGSVRIVSGDSGEVLYTRYGDSAGDRLGIAVGGAFDVDGDGRADFVAGAIGDDDNGSGSGSARVYAGATGATLHTFLGDAAFDGLGISVGSAGDSDGDGFDEVLIGAYWTDVGAADSGSARIGDLGITGTPPRARTFGAACTGTGGRMPRIGLKGRLEIGTTARATLRGAAPNAPGAALMLGDAAPPVPLDIIGLAGCTIYQATFATVNAAPNVFGMSGVDLPLPFAPPMVGLTWDLQWIITDIGAPRALPIALSDVLRITIGD